MKAAKWVIYTSILLAVCVSLALYFSAMPTKGEPIPCYRDPGTALLVVDVQNDFIDEDISGTTAITGFINNVNNLIRLAVDRGWIVAYIRFESSRGDLALRLLTGNKAVSGSKGAMFDQRLEVQPDNIYLVTQRSDAFSNPELDLILREKRVSRLVLAGVNFKDSIGVTAVAAANRRYEVTVAADAFLNTAVSTSDEVLESMRHDYGALVRSNSDIVANTPRP